MAVANLPDVESSADVIRLDRSTAVAAAFLIVAHLPLASTYFVQLWTLPHYQFFPFAIAGAFLLARRAAGTAAAEVLPATNYAGQILFCGITTLAIAILFDSPWLGAVAAYMNSVGYYLALRPALPLSAMIPASVMLATTLRLPLFYDVEIVRFLQSVTSRLASAVLDVLGVTHVLLGNVIEIPGRRLLVEEACSGVNSLFAATACTLFYLFWSRRGSIFSAAVLTSVPFWVIVVNVARVVLVVVLRYWWSVDADDGPLHEAIGLATFATAIGLIASTASLVRFYADLVVDEADESSSVKNGFVARSQSFAQSLRPQWAAVIIGCALLLCLIQAPAALASFRDSAVGGGYAAVPELGLEFVPEQVGLLNRTGYEQIRRSLRSEFGEHSQLWRLEQDFVRGVVSLDSPFTGWHELSACYHFQGWQIEERTVARLGDGSDAVRLVLRHRATGRWGHVVFSIATRAGASMPMPSAVSGVSDKLLAGLSRLALRPNRQDDDATTVQLQIFLESHAPLEPALLENVFGDFEKIFARLKTRLAAPSAASESSQVAGTLGGAL